MERPRIRASALGAPYRGFAAVALIGAVSFATLPPVAILGALVGLERSVYPIWAIRCALFPFLSLGHLNLSADGPITDFPVSGTLLHWTLLGLANSAIASSGLWRRPWVSAGVLVSVSAAVALLAVLVFDLRFLSIRM